MLEIGVESRRDGDYVPFFEAGAEAEGEFHCADCGYGVSVRLRLPVCPMCLGTSWEQSAEDPLERALAYRI